MTNLVAFLQKALLQPSMCKGSEVGTNALCQVDVHILHQIANFLCLLSIL